MLIASGHRFADIQNYTLRQFRAFSKAAARRIELQQAAMTSAALIGARGTEQAIKDYFDKVSKGSK